MLLYLYTSKNSVFSYLSRNLIAPASVVPDRLGIHTVGLLNEDFLFVTHKKLNVDNRNYGIADPDIANPVTLAIEIDSRQENNSCIHWPPRKLGCLAIVDGIFPQGIWLMYHPTHQRGMALFYPLLSLAGVTSFAQVPSSTSLYIHYLQKTFYKPKSSYDKHH